MDKKVEITVLEVVGSPFCVSSNDGQKIYRRLSSALQEGKTELSFHNVSALTGAFLNTAIGQLYGKSREE